MDFNSTGTLAGPYGPFGAHHGIPGWRKVGRGLIAITDGSARQYVAPGLVFGIEAPGGGPPEIHSYWRESGGDAMMKRLYDRPYALRTVRRLVAERQMVRGEAIGYDELVRRVRSVHPGCWIPSPEMLALKYRLTAADGKLL